MEHQKAGSQYVTGWRSETDAEEEGLVNTVAFIYCKVMPGRQLNKFREEMR